MVERATGSGFRFGRFMIDLRTRELRKDGVRRRLQDQPFEVLAMLLRRAGDVVTRDELRHLCTGHVRKVSAHL